MSRYDWMMSMSQELNQNPLREFLAKVLTLSLGTRLAKPKQNKETIMINSVVLKLPAFGRYSALE
jgi:hypothetical protein